MRGQLVLAAFVALAQPAMAQSDAEIMSALGEVAGELQVCSVYFLVTSSCINDQRPDLGNTYRAASDKLSGLAISTGRAVGVSDNAYAAQARMYAQAMMKAMRGNCTNIAILLEKYSNFCKALSEDADPRIKQWIVCLRTRRQTCGGPGLP